MGKIKYLPVFFVLVCLSYIDVKKRVVPDRWVLALFFYSLLVSCDFKAGLWMSAYAFIILYAGYVLTGGGIGGGDVKLLTVLAFMLGDDFFLMVFWLLPVTAFGFVLGAVMKKKLVFEAPLVPYISTAFAIWFLLS